MAGWAVALLVALGFVGICVVLAGADVALSHGKIHRGVQVYGIDVGNLTRRVAAAKLDAVAPRDATVTLAYAGTEWALRADALKARLDGNAAARSAYAYTREGSLLTRAWRRARLWFSAADLQPSVSFDDEALRLELDEIAGVVEQKAVSASVRMNGFEPVVKPAKAGLRLDRGAIERMLAEAIVSGGDAERDLPVVATEPQVSDEDAGAAADQAKRLVAAPIKLVYRDREWKLGRHELATFLAFVVENSEPHLRATFASPVAEGHFHYLSHKVGKPATDAAFRVTGARVKVVRGRDGIGVNVAETAAALEEAALEGGEHPTAKLVLGKMEPELTFREAKALRITRRIATYTTSVTGSSGRLANVRLGAELLSDVLIGPGKVFSVNETTGERTAEKGFQVAPVIINGQLEDSLGGGMCQVSTTLFNAAFEAGLQIVERKNHSLYISHYPLGRDATVSYGSYDLKFRNDTDNWILVKSFFSGSYLTFSLYSAPLHREVVSSTSGWYNIRPYGTQEKKTAALLKGKREVATPGTTGRSITCTRKVYENSKLLWNDTFVSVYPPYAEVVLVGTRAPSPKPSPKPTSSKTGSSKPSPKPTNTGNP